MLDLEAALGGIKSFASVGAVQFTELAGDLVAESICVLFLGWEAGRFRKGELLFGGASVNVALFAGGSHLFLK